MRHFRHELSWLTEVEYAHRGVHRSGVIENSFPAAMVAINHDLGIECDIQMSRDGVPMVFHDWDLNRLKNREELVADVTAAELQAIGIMPLSFLLNIVSDKVPLLIEIKSKPDFCVYRACEAVSACLDRLLPQETAVMSFDPRVPEWFRENSSRVLAGLVMREDEFGDTQTSALRIAAYEQAQPDFLAYHIDALPNPWVGQLRANGLPILTWTVNSPEARRVGLENADALIVEGAGLA